MRVKLLKSGTRFGRLKIVEFSRTIGYRAAYICQCDCGDIKEIKAEKLKAGTTVSCGCYKKEKHSENARSQMTTHGMSYTSAYKRMSNAKRRAWQLAASGGHTAEDIENLRRLQENRCRYCHTYLTQYHVDHKIPLSRGGSDDKQNLCIACPTCNITKRDKTDIEFLELLEEKVSGTGHGVDERKCDPKSAYV